MHVHGVWLMPVAFDKETGRIDALAITGAGSARRYLVAQLGHDVRELTLPTDLESASVQSDAAGLHLLGIERRCGNSGCVGVLWTWSGGDPASATVLQPVGVSVMTATFRPETDDVYALVRSKLDASPAAIEHWASGRSIASRLTELRAGGQYLLFRVDGSAALLGSLDLNDRRGALIDSSTGAAAIFVLDQDVVATLTLN
jgi:hypothetical protein